MGSAILVVLASGCSHTASTQGGIGYSDEVYNASNRASTLQSLSAGDTKPLSELLEFWLARDITLLHSRMSPGTLLPLEPRERSSALRTLVMLAVLNEKYPVAAWSTDKEVRHVLAWALVQDAELTRNIRARDWSKSLLRAQ